METWYLALIPCFCNNKWGSGFSQKAINQWHLKVTCSCSLQTGMHDEKGKAGFIWLTHLAFSRAPGTLLRRAPHLEWDLICQLFKIVWADLHHGIKSTKQNLLALPISHPIPPDKCWHVSDCWRQKQPQLSYYKSNAEPPHKGMWGIITQVFTLQVFSSQTLISRCYGGLRQS